MAANKITKDKARAVRNDLEGLIKKHGPDAVRWAWNRLATASRLRNKLLREKHRVEKELAAVEARFR